MNILVINAGSSSMKYQLLNPETGVLLAKGLCERIGIDGRLTHKVPAKDQKFEAELKKDAQDRLHRSRKEMNVQIEDSCDAFIGEVKDYLKKRSKTYEQMVQDLVDVNLNRELERQQKELDDLIRLIEEKGDQREKSLQQAREQIARLQDITGRAIELETELEENMEDHLEQEELEG